MLEVREYVPEGAYEDDQDVDAATLDEVTDHQRLVAEKIWPNGATLRCSVCGRKEHASTARLARSLAIGLSKCCNTPMWVDDRNEHNSGGAKCPK